MNDIQKIYEDINDILLFNNDKYHLLLSLESLSTIYSDLNNYHSIVIGFVFDRLPIEQVPLLYGYLRKFKYDYPFMMSYKKYYQPIYYLKME